MTDFPYTKIIDIEDFDNPKLLPHLQHIAFGEMKRFGLDEPIILPDSKQWECAMMLRTLTDLGVIRPGALLAGIGAGTEETTFALAAKGCVVFPTDRYLELTPWSDVAPAGMVVRPEQYSEYAYPRGGVIPIHSDARVLSLPSDFFDGVYSAGSIEHFGSLEAVAAAAEEIGRVLKPGGVAVLSTEFRLDGPNDRRWFSDDCILFTPELLQSHIVGPSGLELIGEPNFATSQGTFDSQVVLVDFLNKAKRVRTLADKRDAYPNLVLFHEGYLFCSVHLALRKPKKPGSVVSQGHSKRFEGPAASDAMRASGIMTSQMVEWTKTYGLPTGYDAVTRSALADQERQFQEVATAREQQFQEAAAAWGQQAAAWQQQYDQTVRHYEAHIAFLQQSRSFRMTRPIRDAARIARRVPGLRQMGVMTMAALRSAKRLFN
jgi:SAM-dependent methyltransferase